MNPGLALAGAVLLHYLVRAHLVWRRTGVWPETPPRDAAARRRLSWLVGGGILLNWAYVIWHEAALAAAGRLG